MVHNLAIAVLVQAQQWRNVTNTQFKIAMDGPLVVQHSVIITAWHNVLTSKCFRQKQIIDSLLLPPLSIP